MSQHLVAFNAALRIALVAWVSDCRHALRTQDISALLAFYLNNTILAIAAD